MQWKGTGMAVGWGAGSESEYWCKAPKSKKGHSDAED